MLDGYLMAGMLAGVTLAAIAACRACIRAERAAENARYHVGVAARLADMAGRSQAACANYVLEAAGFANDAADPPAGPPVDGHGNEHGPLLRSVAPDVVPFPATRGELPTLHAEADTDEWDVDPVPIETGNPVA